jgi:L-aminopeptidase/D-esterase-like protein
MTRTILFAAFGLSLAAAEKPRARDLGVPFDGTPGALNAITDVKGVEVGQTTLIRGEGVLKPGQGPVRTGVTVILPRGKRSKDPVFAGWFSLNGNGEMTGTTWVEESGFMEGPMAITNTHSVGVVRDAIIAWQFQHDLLRGAFALPVVAETNDGWLNDINGFHVKPEHVFHALETASTGSVAEGNVGGGTGMHCYDFKGGTGTASRKLPNAAGGYTVGVLVQANFGTRRHLMVAGAPVGKEISCDKYPCRPIALPAPARDGSIIIVVATDAPLIAPQLRRLAVRAGLGIARTGGMSGNGSGDIFLAFSTANPGAAEDPDATTVRMLSNRRIDELFEATVFATEEAVINAMVAAETMVGRDYHQWVGLPHEELKQVLRKYRRLGESK